MDAVKLLKSLMGNNATGGNLLGSLLGKITGSGSQPDSQPKSGGGGGLGSLIGGLLGGGGGKSSAGGMLGGLLGSGVLGSLLGGNGSSESAPAALASPSAEEEATLLIRAMCNAAKSDGSIDKAEQQKIIGKLGSDVSQAEIDFVEAQLMSPLDPAGFAASVPAEMAASVYAVSLMTITVDTPQEAQYLQQLAGGLNLDRQTVSAIHQQLGVA